MRNISRKSHGFTIVETLIVVAVIGILSAITVLSLNSVQADSRDSQRASKASILAEALEKYYERNGVYPDCSSITQSPATVVATTLTKMDPNILTSPTDSSGANSVVCTDTTSDKFVYVTDNGGWTLKYKDERTGTIQTITSRRVAVAAITDNFNRTGSSLGATTGGNKTWSVLVGTWSTNGANATTSTAASSNPAAVVDSGYANINASIDISASGGGDSLVVRSTDGNNYIRARYYHTRVGTTTPASCTIGTWQYVPPQVYTENWTPGSVIPSDKVGGDCIPYDDFPGINGSGVAQTKTVVTSTHVTCNPPYVNVCYWGNVYQRTVVDTPAQTTYTDHYFVYLEKRVGGAFTTMYSTELASPVSNLRIKAIGSNVSLYINNSSTAKTMVTDSFNSSATKHGIGRGTTGDYVTSAIDNFTLSQQF